MRANERVNERVGAAGTPAVHAETELPLLAAIGAGLRWLEELVTLASGPLLTVGLGIALVDLLTSGQLLASQPELLYAWAVAMAIGVDGQLIGAAVKAGRAARTGHPWRCAGYSVLMAALGYVAYLAGNVFATQEALGLTTQEALSRLGMDGTTWIVTRSVLAVALVMLSGLLRYDPVAPAAESAEMRAEREARELAEARHRATLGALKVAARRQQFAAALGRVNPLEAAADTPGDGADEHPGTDARTTGEDAGQTTLHVVPSGQAGRRGNVRGTGGMHVPSTMMTSPQFRAYLAANGLAITPEKAVAIVQSVGGFKKLGTTYMASKARLVRIASDMLHAAHTPGDVRSESGQMASA